ncbi:MAG: hypothetical protein AB7I41_01565, partial [Candidatus Sericytochromatia bacterium]
NSSLFSHFFSGEPCAELWLVCSKNSQLCSVNTALFLCSEQNAFAPEPAFLHTWSELLSPQISLAAFLGSLSC